MAELHTRFPTDSEAAIFYALALNATLLYSDKWMDARDDDAADIYALQVLEAATTDVDPGTAPHVFTFVRPSPNPAHGPISLRFALPHYARTRLDIYDANGRRVRQLGSATRPVGERTRRAAGASSFRAIVRTHS